MIKTRFRDIDIKTIQLLNRNDNNRYEAVLLIEDYKYWMLYEQEIKDWLISSKVDYLLAGMLLLLHNEQDKSAFMMRWA